MAAGINIGEDDGEKSTLDRLRKSLLHLRTSLTHSGRAFVERLGDIAPRLSETLDRDLAVAMARQAGRGAAIGALLVAGGFVAIAAEAALTAPTAPVEVALVAAEPAAKADRLALGGKLAAVAALPSDPSGPGAGGDFATASLPLGYASSELRDAAGAIDRVLDPSPIAAAPSATINEDEDDDEAVVPAPLPMPRARPQYDPPVVNLPIPRPRPMVLASLTPSVAPSEPRVEEPVRRAPEPSETPPGLLGFFSSPTDPVKPPSRSKIDTPFGVPYVLQTGSVETACLKPELVDILRKVEGHYGQKVVITSGFRDRGRQGSLHRTCAAADIEVPGVAASALASWVRTIPAIGGVGTYCHAHMIHVDIGTPRDWKYGCGSFFAMRGGPGKWGRVPAALAKAQGTGAPQAVASDAAEED